MASSEMERLASEMMVMKFRVAELKMLLIFAGHGRCRPGRKWELQQRALDLIKLNSPPINKKIRQLYRSILLQNVLPQPKQPQKPPQPQEPPQAQEPPRPPQPQEPPQLPKHQEPSRPQEPPQPPQPQPGCISMSATGSEIVAPAPKANQQVIPMNPTAEGLPVWPLVNPNKNSRSNYSGPDSFKPIIPPVQAVLPAPPDVRLKKLPFFDSIAELLRPSPLISQRSQDWAGYHSASFEFNLTAQQAADIASCRDARRGSKIDPIIEIQMRFCVRDTSCEQEDKFPSHLLVKINGKMVSLADPMATNKFAGVEARPINITQLCHLSSTTANHINVVSCSSDPGGRRYAVTVSLVRRLTWTDLLNRLKGNGVRPAQYIRDLIRDQLKDGDTEMAITSFKVSLACPLGKTRMHLPCRAISCSHLQCFDASLFLQMNERKPTWLCPVCDKSVLYEQLAIDGYFCDILDSPLLPSDSMEVQLNVDGTWTVLRLKKDLVYEVAPRVKKQVPITVDLTLSDSEEDVNAGQERLLRKRSFRSQSSHPSKKNEEPMAKKKAPVTTGLALNSSEEDGNVVQKRLVSERSSGSQSVCTSATGASSSSCPLSPTNKVNV